MILVCGGLADKVTELMCSRLEDCGYPYRFLDLARFPRGYTLTARWDGATPSGYLAGDGWRLGFDQISGVFVRYLGADGRIAPAELESSLIPSVYAEADAALMTLFEQLTCPVVNRVAGGVSNNSKPYQALIIRNCGLLVPPTLVTCDPAAAEHFCSAWDGAVIYKSLSGQRSIVRRVGVEQRKRFDLLTNGPAQFQAQIVGQNIRVHTVGDQLFVTRVRSDSIDYRYSHQDGGHTELEESDLPPAIGAACLRLARELDLLVAGIDLMETPDGQYYCFEVNPAPGFLYYERVAGQPISAAIAELLHNGQFVGAATPFPSLVSLRESHSIPGLA